MSVGDSGPADSAELEVGWTSWSSKRKSRSTDSQETDLVRTRGGFSPDVSPKYLAIQLDNMLTDLHRADMTESA